MPHSAAELIEAARRVCGQFALEDDFSAGSVGAAILTERGDIFTGISIELACGLGFCAEVAAVAEMLKARQTHIAAVVAVAKTSALYAPCGRCREMMVQVDARNLDCRVILGEHRTVFLRELLPDHWLTAKAARRESGNH